MMTRFGRWIPLMISLIFAIGLLAQTTEKSENTPIGIKEIKPGFQVFPYGKMGNTLYADKKKIVSRADLILHDIMEAPLGYVYYGTNETQEDVLGYVGSDTAEFNRLEGGFYHLNMADGKKKLYRVTQDKRIQNLLPRSNTATGLVYNDVDKAAFYHITKGETVEVADGSERYQYTFRIHIVKDKDERVIDLPDTVSDFRYRLRLNWVNPSTLEYTLSNGQKETIVIR